MRQHVTKTADLRRKRTGWMPALAALTICGCAATHERTPHQIASPIDVNTRDASATHASQQPMVAASVIRPVSHRELSPPLPTASYDSALVAVDGQSDEVGVPILNSNETTSNHVENELRGVTGQVTTIEQPVEYFVSIALAGHPKILAARHRVAAATNVIPQARALPDPMFGNTFWPIHDQSLQTAGGRVSHQFQLSQGVPWPEKLHTKAAIASREVQMAQAEVQRAEREITEMVRLAYYEVWFATRAIAIVSETRELVDDLTQVAETRYKSGESQQDLLRAQLEADRLDDQLVGLRKQKEQAQADLAALVQQPVSLMPEAQQDVGLANVPTHLDELLALAEQCSPELRSLAWEIQRDRQKQRLACLQRYPDFNLGLNYSIINDDTNVLSPVANGHDNIGFVMGVTLPIWRDKINAGMREAANRTSSTANRLEAERDMIQGKLRRLIVQADSLVEQEGIYKKRIIPRAEDTLKLSIVDYRGKRTDFFSLVATYRELLMFETQLARIEATLAGTVAQIERTIGVE